LLLGISPARSSAEEEVVPLDAPLPEVVVNANQSTGSTLGASKLGAAGLSAQRATTSDSAKLLQDVPGVSLYGAGGVSSLPAIHGLADDRLRVQVDGMDLVSACPNHMNSPLSYIDPSKVASATVFAGITPVSVGGDSIGGTIQVKSVKPEFAASADTLLRKGEGGAFYRSNGHARGGNLGATLASESLHVSYGAAVARSNNYHAAQAFKAAGVGAAGGRWLAGDEVGSSEFVTLNQTASLAWKHAEHLLRLDAGMQDAGFEGFPNQRMDMTANQSAQFNLQYTGWYAWGDLELRVYDQYTQHGMNMGPDRFSYGALGMPMDTEAKTSGFQMQGNVVLSARDILRAGAELQRYTLYDWWPPVGSGGSMGPNTYWNIDYGRRDRFDLYSEWESLWNPQWTTQLGVRTDTVVSDVAPVQGYNATPMWAEDAAALNARARKRTDRNWDVTALARHTPSEMLTLDGGYARKSHSPNLYQRYSWSTQPMAALMNNFVGDGNGYVGDVALKPEVAHIFSLGADWHDAERELWDLKATGYHTLVEDFIDARRCDFGQCGGAANVAATTGFVNLQFANQTARLYGFDLSGKRVLIHHSDHGSFTGSGLLNFVRGENRTTGDALYNIMPLNAKLALLQQQGTWSNTAEVQWVDAKTRVSTVRNEMQTAAYTLVHLRSSYSWEHARLDLAVENLLDRFYMMPLGGAYLGQGASMSSGSIPWGVPVPGMGRSFNVSLSADF